MENTTFTKKGGFICARNVDSTQRNDSPSAESMHERRYPYHLYLIFQQDQAANPMPQSRVQALQRRLASVWADIHNSNQDEPSTHYRKT